MTTDRAPKRRARRDGLLHRRRAGRPRPDHGPGPGPDRALPGLPVRRARSCRGRSSRSRRPGRWCGTRRAWTSTRSSPLMAEAAGRGPRRGAGPLGRPEPLRRDRRADAPARRPGDPLRGRPGRQRRSRPPRRPCKIELHPRRQEPDRHPDPRRGQHRRPRRRRPRRAGPPPDRRWPCSSRPRRCPRSSPR